MILPRDHHKPTLVNAQATYYPHMVSVYIPNDPILRNPSSSTGKIASESQDSKNKETNAERSIRRTRKTINDYVLCNNFELFATFTFAKNRQDIKQKRQQMSDWIRNQRKRNGKFSYIIVPEFHKDKESLHFHALISGYFGSIKKSINPKTGKHLIQGGQQVYYFPEYTLGFTNVKAVSASLEDKAKVAYYIQKYITKDMPEFYGRKRYWASKNLQLPKIEDNPAEWYKHIKPDWEVELEHGKLLRFNAGSNPLIDLYLEAKS